MAPPSSGPTSPAPEPSPVTPPPALPPRDPDAELAAHLAQAVCAEAALHTTESCLQMMGGIGFTWEHPTHLSAQARRGWAAPVRHTRSAPTGHRRLRDIPTELERAHVIRHPDHE